MKRAASLKLKSLAVLTVLFSLISFQPASAAQFANTMNSTCNNTSGDSTWLPAIPFNVPESATVTRINWQLFSGGAPTGEIVYIRADNAGAPTGSTLGTFTYSSFASPIATLTGSATMSTAGRYWLVFKQSTTLNICYTTTPVYTGSPTGWTMGTTYTWQSSDGGSTFNSRSDYMVFNFTLFGTGGGVAPPASTISLSTPSITVFRQSTTVSASLGVAGTDGKVTFYANGKKIPGCIGKASTSLAVSCSWRPAMRGSISITAKLVPTDTSYSASTSAAKSVLVSNRAGTR